MKFMYQDLILHVCFLACNAAINILGDNLFFVDMLPLLCNQQILTCYPRLHIY